MTLSKILAQINITTNDVNIPTGANPSSALKDGLQIFFGLAGVIALIVITVAGLQFVLSQGEPQKIAKARNTILYAIVGLVVSIFAFSIVGFVVENI